MVTTGTTRRRLDPAVRRQEIAEAAARVFAREEPNEVSFETVADEAGVSRSLVYSYFGDRGSLFAAAYAHEIGLLDAEIGDALDAVGTNRDRLAAAVRAYLRFALAHRTAWQLIVSASSSRHPAVKAAMSARVDRIAATIDESAETRLLVRSVLGMLEAAAVHSLDLGDADADHLADLLTTVLWSGLPAVPTG